MLDAKIIEEALKENKSLNESKKVESINSNKSAKEVLFENLLMEMYPIAGGYYKTKQTKYTRIRDLIRSLQDALYKVESCGFDKERNPSDSDIYDTISQTYESIINTLITRIGEVWETKEEDYKEDEPEQDEPESPDSESEHPDAQTLMVQLTPNESIISPQNKEYIVESIADKLVMIKDKDSGEMFSVEKEVALKWKKNKEER